MFFSSDITGTRSKYILERYTSSVHSGSMKTVSQNSADYDYVYLKNHLEFLCVSIVCVSEPQKGLGIYQQPIIFGTTPAKSVTVTAMQYTVSSQPRTRGGWRKTTEQGAERFVAKWIAAEKVRAGLWHALARLNATGRTKERIAQSKRARAGSLAINS